MHRSAYGEDTQTRECHTVGREAFIFLAEQPLLWNDEQHIKAHAIFT